MTADRRLRKHLFLPIALGSLLFYSLDFSLLQAEEELAALADEPAERGYKINFNNVSIIEYIKYVSKINNVNFVFDEEDLQFNVTIVSEEPISSRNILSALVQVLRVHGLTLLEEDNNLLITKSTAGVNQIPTIVSSDVSGSEKSRAPLVTRIFRIKNANVTTIASIIRPMASSTALIDVSLETKQLIVTDVATNVDKIATLLLSLDAPHTSLDVESYTAKNVAPAELINLATQILTPFAEGNPLLFVPQLDTNTIFVVSTPYLIERAMTVMEDLDVPSKASSISAEGIFLYKIQNRTAQDLSEALGEIASDLKKAVPPPLKLVRTINNMKWIEETDSLLFIGDNESVTKIKEILATLDAPGGAVSQREAGIPTFFLYKLQAAQGDGVLKALDNIAEGLPAQDLAQKAVAETIENIKWVKENNSLLITGPSAAVEKVKELVAQFDVPGLAGIGAPGGKSSFVIYKPQHQSAEFIQNSLDNIATDLEQAGLSDPDLLHTLKTMRYTAATNSILFTGTPEALQKVNGLVAEIDVVTPQGGAIQRIGSSTFLIYKLEHATAAQFMNSFKTVAAELDKSNVLDKELGQTIATMKWIKETNSILFTGTPHALERIEALAEKFDIASLGSAGKAAPVTYVLYSPKYLSGPDLITLLCNFENTLMQTGVSDTGLFDAINNLQWMDETSSLIITGDSDSITKIQGLLQRFDAPGRGGEGGIPSIESLESTSFLVYKLQYHQGTEILNALKQVSTELTKATATPTQNLVTAINSLQWINVTNSLLATGEPDALTKLRDLIQNLDVPLTQVFIEVLIIETSLANVQNFGVSWGGFAKYRDKVGMGYGNNSGTNPLTGGGGGNPTFINGLKSVNATTFPNPNTMIPFVNGFDLGAIGDAIFHKGKSYLTLGSFLTAVQTDTDVTIVLNPKIITQDTNNSTIFVGQNIPYTGSNLTITGAAGQESSNIEYRDIGMNLSITPYVGNNDIVTLEISNDLSTQIHPTDGFTIPTNTILTSHASLNTRVHVPDKHFVILSGMIHDSKTHFKSGIPCLGGLPVIGAIFSENDRSDSKDNIIIFIRPHILRSYDEYKAITDHQEQLYKENAVLPVMKEEFDDGLNLVKQPDNE